MRATPPISDGAPDQRGARVVDAVRSCWASLWPARAIEYRRREGIGPADVALAVVVQELVGADAAGMLFTADPATGATDRIPAVVGTGTATSVLRPGDRVRVDASRGTVEVLTAAT